MYSHEDRKRAVELYIEYNLSTADVIRELGYPNRIWTRFRGYARPRRKGFALLDAFRRVAARSHRGMCGSGRVSGGPPGPGARDSRFWTRFGGSPPARCTGCTGLDAVKETARS